LDELARLILENPGATAFGVLGLGCQLAWPWFRTRRMILSIQLGVGLLYCAQYALLGAFSAAGVCAIGATQTSLALAAGDRPWLRRAGLVFLPIVATLCFATWSGLPSLFALFGVTLIMLGRMQQDVMRLRMFQLGSAPFAIGHDMLVGAAPALIGCIVSACVASAALLRELRLRRQAPALV
jgi:hypothetical protein